MTQILRERACSLPQSGAFALDQLALQQVQPLHFVVWQDAKTLQHPRCRQYANLQRV